MPKFRVYLSGAASYGVTVEAKDPDAAEEVAYQESVPAICARCSGWHQPWHLEVSEEWEVDEVEQVEDSDDAIND